ncbi:MAG TPA: DUF2089 family protein [Bacteroidaceae bacterium]|nr:DUF2089 family protein [Bacteroidaceae bacterium]
MLPILCPSCNKQLRITCMNCYNCETEVKGSFALPLLARLSEADQQFILRFVKNSGSLKNMATELKLSYPTVRNLLNDIIEKLNNYEI